MPTKPTPVPTPGYAQPQFETGDLAVMKPAEIVEHRLAGRLDAVLGAPPRPGAERLAGDGQLTADDLKLMTPHQINEARAAGRLGTLLGSTTTNPTTR